MSVPYSILDLSPIPEGMTATDALSHSRDLAQHAEAWGYTRYWLAEHHNMTGNASAATSVVIGHVAAGTKTIRVGAGGIMLPNHAPLVIAEQFGTLDALFPGRIDLGLGRAPGTDQMTARALRRDLMGSDDGFAEDVQELQYYFEDLHPNQAVKAIPGIGSHVPLWILGSSLYGAQLAAHLGLPYAFASHFAPDYLLDALATYRQMFKASKQSQKSHAMVGVNVIVAETDEEAQYLFTSLQQNFVRMRRNTRGQLPAPIDDIEAFWLPHEKASVMQSLSCSVVGSFETIKNGLREILHRTQADELILAGQIHNHQKRLKSFELAAKAMQSL